MIDTSSARLSPGRADVAVLMGGDYPSAMIREDFLMRLIRQATEAIARMIRKRDDGEYDAAQRDADGAYDLLGIPRELCDVVDTPTLAGLLGEAEKIRVAARLFWE